MTNKDTTVKESTLKSYKSKIEWTTQRENLPFSQGWAINEIIKQHNLPAIAWGYDGYLVGVETKDQYIFYRSNGVALEFKGLLNKTDKDKMPKKASKSSVDMKTSLFTAADADEVVQKLQNGLKFPYVNVSKSLLGGNDNVSIIVKMSLQPKEDWANGIWQNSNYGIIHISRWRTVELSYGSGLKMRKFKAKSIEHAIEKINEIKVK